MQADDKIRMETRVSVSMHEGVEAVIADGAFESGAEYLRALVREDLRLRGIEFEELPRLRRKRKPAKERDR